MKRESFIKAIREVHRLHVNELIASKDPLTSPERKALAKRRMQRLAKAEMKLEKERVTK